MVYQKPLHSHNHTGRLTTTEAASNAGWPLPKRVKPIIGGTSATSAATPLQETIDDHKTSPAAFVFNHSKNTKNLQDDGRWSDTQVCVYIYVQSRSSIQAFKPGITIRLRFLPTWPNLLANLISWIHESANWRQLCWKTLWQQVARLLKQASKVNVFSPMAGRTPATRVLMK